MLVYQWVTHIFSKIWEAPNEGQISKSTAGPTKDVFPLGVQTLAEDGPT